MIVQTVVLMIVTAIAVVAIVNAELIDFIVKVWRLFFVFLPEG